MQNQIDSKLGKIVALKINNGKPEQGELKKWDDNGVYEVNYLVFSADNVTKIVGDYIPHIYVEFPTRTKAPYDGNSEEVNYPTWGE